MITTVLLLVALLCGGAYVYAHRNTLFTKIPPSPGFNRTEIKFNPKHVIIGAAIALSGIIAAIFQPFTLERVDADMEKMKAYFGHIQPTTVILG